ncbi:hypothetical protein BR93DRAFT_941257 [Coniochaeta sp. PMI_546]|nr:hypothetical protein BR93DRAFT_941257 [Coniochaeta sp. PMI_546]
MATSRGAPPKGSHEYFKNVLRDTCEATAQNWVTLKKIFDRDYDLIKDFWKKDENSAYERGLIIDRAKGGSRLADRRRPDINGFVEGDKIDQNELIGFLFPHLSKEDLIQGKIILIFFYHRSNHHWTEYCHTDLFSTRAAQKRADAHGFYVDNNAVDPPPGIEKYLVSFKKRQLADINSDKPGRFEDYCEEHLAEIRTQRIRKSVAKGRDVLDKFSYSQALMVSKIQGRVYQLLVAICLDIVIMSRRKDKEKLEKRDNKKKKRNKKKKKEGEEEREDEEEEDPAGGNPGIDVLANFQAYHEEKLDLLKEYAEYKIQDKQYTAPKVRSDSKEAKIYKATLPLLTEARLQASYGPPDVLAWDVLERHLVSRVTDTRIALLQLRKDPDIFEESVRRERWKRDFNNDPSHPAEIEPTKGEFAEIGSWRDAMKFCIGNAIKDFDRWSSVYEAFNDLKATYEEHQATLKLRDNSEVFWAAARRLDTALYGFYYRAREFSESLVQELRSRISSTHFYDDYIRLDTNEIGIKKASEKVMNIFAKLASLLSADRRVQFGLSALLDDLEREINDTFDPKQSEIEKDSKTEVAGENDPERDEDSMEEEPAQDARQEAPKHSIQEDLPEQEEEEEGPEKSTTGKKKKKKKKKKNKKSKAANQNYKAYLTRDVLELLGDLAVFAECLSQVEHFQPWAMLFFADWNDDAEKETVRLSVKTLNQHFKELTESNRAWKTSHRRGLPKPGRFHYPIHEERTQHNIDLLQLAESNLDDFWEELLRELDRERQDGLSQRARQLLSEKPARVSWEVQPAGDDSKEKEPKEKEQQEQQEEERKEEVETVAVPEVAVKPQDSPPKTPSPGKRHREEDEQPLEESPGKKRKVGNVTSQATKKDEEEKHSYISESGKILLPRKVYPDIFYLFHKPGARQGKGVLPWKRLMKLMVALGFSASSHSGSQWHFSPVADHLKPKKQGDKAGPIRIDEPHPETYKTFAQLRMLGDNLHNRYQWTYHSFEEI